MKRSCGSSECMASDSCTADQCKANGGDTCIAVTTTDNKNICKCDESKGLYFNASGDCVTTPCTKIPYIAGYTDCSVLTGCANGTNKTAPSYDNCTCATGYILQDDGSCKASSASPFAIALICAMIISIAASIATAVVVVKRKANERRNAEALVSDAL